jgi:hypothetical protein
MPITPPMSRIQAQTGTIAPFVDVAEATMIGPEELWGISENA